MLNWAHHGGDRSCRLLALLLCLSQSTLQLALLHLQLINKLAQDLSRSLHLFEVIFHRPKLSGRLLYVCLALNALILGHLELPHYELNLEVLLLGCKAELLQIGLHLGLGMLELL